MVVNPDVDSFTKTLNHWKILRKNAKRIHPIAVVLNRGYTYPLGVPNTATGGYEAPTFL